MKIKQKIQNVFVALIALFSMAIVSAATATPALAQTQCGGEPTAIINCSQADKEADEIEKTGLWGLLILTVNILIAGVGVLALAGLVYGAILYTSAGGSTEQIKKARTIFTNVVIGVIAFGAMYILLNFLIPGGLFT